MSSMRESLTSQDDVMCHHAEACSCELVQSPAPAAVLFQDAVPSTEAFVWTSAFETGLSTVDEQHRCLVRIINDVGELVSGNHRVANVDLERHIAALRSYTVYHFEEEELLMRSSGVWAAHQKRHMRQHAYFIAEIDRLSTQVTGVQGDAAAQVLRFLSSWLAYHILGTDQSLARQISCIENGASAESAFAEEQDPTKGRTEPLLDALDALFHHAAASNETLRELNATLEQRVAARTAELTVAVRHLESKRAESLRISEKLTEANRRLEMMAMTDVLSGLPNRRRALLELDAAWNCAEDGGRLSVIVIDVDHFKEINDTFGHDAGDEVIVALARELRNAVRTDDIVCRMGGDEFLILCPSTDQQGARRVAETVWRAVGGMTVRFGVGRWLGSVSVGVATRTAEMGKIADVIKAADDAVYAAKQAGRDRVVSAA